MLAVISLSTETVVPKKEKRINRIILLVVGILVLILGVSAIVCGVVIAALNLGTDANGFALSNVYEVRSSACAFILFLEPAEIPPALSWLGTENLVETKWVVGSVDNSNDVFVGWTKEADTWVYVNDFQFGTPPNWTWNIIPYSPEINITTSNVHNTGVPSSPPADESFWLASESSSDLVELEWNPVWDVDEEGRKVLFIMNSDGSNNVEADVQIAFKVPIFGWLPFLLIPLGLVAVLIVLFVFRRKKLVRFLAKSDS